MGVTCSETGSARLTEAGAGGVGAGLGFKAGIEAKGRQSVSPSNRARLEGKRMRRAISNLTSSIENGPCNLPSI